MGDGSRLCTEAIRMVMKGALRYFCADFRPVHCFERINDVRGEYH